MASSAIIAGIDEAGRGALAGPVVAAACILPTEMEVPSFICDSKQLKPKKREHALRWIVRHCVFGVGKADELFIDRHGILAATELAMQQALEQLCIHKEPTYLLVDGRDAFWFPKPHSSIINGDALEPCIAAASIVAKVTRDRMMVRYSYHFARYGFGQHKGYGTSHHLKCIKACGPCLLHRRTFLKKLYAEPVLLA